MFARFGSSLLLVLFAVYALTLTVPYGYAALGLDPSWNLGINMSIANGAVFGQDVAFTYGPLGFLNYRVMPEGYSIYGFLVFDLFVVGLATAALAFALRRAGSYKVYVGLVAMVCIYPEGLFADRVFSLLFYEMAFLIYALQERKFWALLPPALIAVLLFFIKVNVLFIAGPYLLFSLVYAGWMRIFPWKRLAFVALGYLGSLVFLAAKLQVDIPAYVKNSIQLTDGYMDAMSSFQLYLNEFFLLAFLEILLVLGWGYLFWQGRKNARKHGHLIFSVVLLLLLAFKQSHVGIGFGGFRNFFLMIPAIVLMYLVFMPGLWIKKKLRVSVGMFLVYVVAVVYTGYGMADRSWSAYLRSRPLPHMNVSYYFVPFTWYDYAKNFDQKALKLPDSVRQKLDGGTVDFLQHDLGYIYFNRLRYQPRPVIQSYSVYTPALIQQNGAHYRSAKAPDWVLFKLEPFRNQNPFWMDSEVTLELLKRYQLQESVMVKGDTLQLLKRGGGLQNPRVQELRINDLKLGEVIRIPPGGLVRLQVDVRYSFWGKLMRLLIQPPYLYATVRYVDGQERRFRVIAPLLQAGIWVGGRVQTQADLRTFLKTAGKGNVAAEQVVLHSPMGWAWK